MKTTNYITIVAIGVLSLSACSKTDSPKTQNPAPSEKVQTKRMQTEKVKTAAPQANEMEENHDHKFSGGVKDYHDIMSPDWHMDAGDERIASTCDNVDEYVLKAMALTSEPAPKGVDAKAWKDAVSGLLEANKTLNLTCANEDKEKFAADFTTLHDKFHVLKDLIEG